MSLLLFVTLSMALLQSSASAQQPSPAPDTLFAVRFTTGPKWDSAKAPNVQEFFAEHSANLSRLRREGVLVIGARYGEVGLVVLRLPDEDAVKAQLARDPSIEAGTFVAQIDRFMPFMHGSTQAPLATREAIALRAYYDAFNRHEADATAAFLAKDVKWYSVSGDTQSLDGDGRESIRDWLAGYFKKLPDVKSDVLELRQTGSHLFVHERVSWTGADGTAKRASALAIYEVRDELIQRVWYFPAGE
ncbi:MAG TPA: nuclear transport factor 2 family protein [Opitutaceae bacterium]|nr:nuclear transport factor 2 family protein [Opitutaceae bacterium]